MRIGQNPAKFIDQVAQPQKVTVALVIYLPFLEGYYAEGLEILKVCLESIWQNTDQPYDLLVFDNASCPAVRDYLNEQQRLERIQYLVLSDKNIGKGGAWNFIFQAAPGEFIAYADSDVYFHRGWLPAQLALFEIFPKLGMVTGTPLRVPEEFSTSTVEWAQNQPGVELQRGVLIGWEDYWKHAHSLGIETEEEGRKLYGANQDVCLDYQGVRYFIGAAHYQFVARKAVLQSVLPLPSQRPMGQMRLLDIAINERGYLRLSTPDWWVEHLGNTLAARNPKPAATAETQKLVSQQSEVKNGIWQWKPLRKLLLGLYKKIFEILYR